MNWNIFEGNYKQFSGKLQARWGKLTDDHRVVIAGKRIELEGRIQEAYGRSTDEAAQQLKWFAQQNKDYRPKNFS